MIESERDGDYTFAEMRRALIKGWGELGARTADAWLDFNRRYFGGELQPIPIFFTNTTPFGKRLAHCRCESQCTHIALNRPSGHAHLIADRDTLLHEMIHQYLGQRGENPKHAGEPWRREIMRLHREITGASIWAGKPTVAKVKEAAGRKSVRRMQPHPETGEASLTQKQIACWPHDRSINLGRL